MGGFSRDYIFLRADRSYQCMKVIKDTGVPPWEWGELSVVDFKTKLDGARTLLESESDESADTIGARGSRDANLETLRERGRNALANLRSKYRKDKVKLPVLNAVSLDGASVTATLNDARNFSSVWAEVNAAYEAEDGLTLAAYDALRTTCGSNQESVGKEGAEEATATGRVKVELEDLYDVCVAWYDTATRKYKEATPFGIMIRRHVPVTPTTGLDKPLQAILTAEPGIGQVTLTVVSEGATTYSIRFRPVGTTDWIDVVVGHAEGNFTQTGLAAGNYEYIAQGHNNDGDGPESEVVAVEVT
jgi:hypothetical protein